MNSLCELLLSVIFVIVASPIYRVFFTQVVNTIMRL